MSETLAEVYGTERWGRAYGYRDSIYAGGWHRGQDIRKQNQNKTASVTHEVRAIRSGKVVYVGRKLKIGLTIVLDVGDVFESHSHLRNAQVKVGETVSKGELLAWTDTNRLTAGTSWGGPHDHVVFGKFYDTAWNTTRTPIDPRPFIRAALVKPAPAVSQASIEKTWPHAHVTTTDLNIRQKPDGKAKVVATVKRGISVRTGKVSGAWAYIRTSRGTTGWMNRTYLIPKYVKASRATALRNKPDTKAPVVMKLAKGTPLTVTGIPADATTKNSGWRSVRLENGREGWVLNRMLTGR